MIARRFCFVNALLAALFVLAGKASAQCNNSAVPGKFYEYYIVALTGSCNGNTFTAIGGNPAINDLGQVAFMAQTSTLSGTALWVGDGHLNPADQPINPGEVGSSEIYDGAVQLSTSLSGVQLVSKDSITTTSPATTSIRLWNAGAQDSFKYIARGGPHQQFSAIFPFPTVNKNGDVALMALSGTQRYLVELPNGGTLAQRPVKVSVGEPMIDDNGDVILYQQTTVPSNGFQLMLYQSNLSQFTVIADYNTFTSIDSAPGISHDGMVIAFQGNLSSAGATSLGMYPGPGIFAATNEGGGTWHITRVTGLQVEVPNDAGGNHDGICDPGEQCEPAAELGYATDTSPISFAPSGYGVGTRVAVANLGLGAAGIDDDSFVIAFVGTPTDASRPNPVLNNGTPLFFSDQQGLWTIRVDVEHQLSSPNARVYHARTAIPVVQIGDMLGGNVVSTIGAYDDIGNAATDESGAIRTMRRGDHRLAFWASTSNGGQILIRANHLDSDQDGLLDHWESTGIDMDQDGVVDLNLPAMGANPNMRDLFMEIDWVLDQPPYSFRPAPGVISAAKGEASGYLENMFNNAPALTGNEYGARIDGSAPEAIPGGITLHIDGGPGTYSKAQGAGPLSIHMGAGPLNGGDQIGENGSTGLPEVIYFGLPGSVSIPGVNTRAFQDVKDHFFGSMDKDGRELAFHYVIFGDYFQAYVDDNGSGQFNVTSATADSVTASVAIPDGVSNGDILKITGGTGAGQYQVVFSTDGDTIQTGTDWDTVPDTTSTFSILSGNSGLSEEFVNPGPDYNSLPGNDAIVVFGNNMVPQLATPPPVLGTPCYQWRTLAHELGHTLGLRHGGTDNDDQKGDQYLSLMSYSWQLECDSNVQSFSITGDPTFNDWGNLQHNFADSAIHLGNTFGLSFGTFAEVNQFSPEQKFTDYLAQNGGLDTTPPVVKVESPAASAQVGLTLPLTVTVKATDNVKVASVTVSFDVNGNGAIDPTETLVAQPSGSHLYKATFPALSGSAGNRTVTASAIDPTGNSATKNVSVEVVQPNPVPAISKLTPSSATHGGPAFTLTVKGSNLVKGCILEWNGARRTTTFVSATKVTASILATDIAATGTASVTVKNPTPGGGVSNALTFTIH